MMKNRLGLIVSTFFMALGLFICVSNSNNNFDDLTERTVIELFSDDDLIGGKH